MSSSSFQLPHKLTLWDGGGESYLGEAAMWAKGAWGSQDEESLILVVLEMKQSSKKYFEYISGLCCRLVHSLFCI